MCRLARSGFQEPFPVRPEARSRQETGRTPPLCVLLSGMAGGPAGQGSSAHLGPLPRASSLPLGGIRRVATAAGAMTSAEGSSASAEIFMA